MKSSESSVKSAKPFRDIPSPFKMPVIGHLHLFSRLGPYSFGKLYDAYEDFYRQYGPIVRLNLGTSIVALFDPKDIEELLYLDDLYPKRPIFEALQQYRLKKKDLYTSGGLVTENGIEWRRLRKAVNFMMEPRVAKAYFPVQEKVAQDFVHRIKCKRNSKCLVPNFLQELYRFSGEAFGLVCFGTRLGLLNQDDKYSERLMKAADDTMQAMADTLLGFPWWKIFSTPTYKKLVQSQDFFQSFAMDCVKQAKSNMDKNLEEEEEVDSKLLFFKRVFANSKLEPTDISLLMTELFSAGIDATGNSLGFLLYNLTKRNEVQERLYEEIQKHTRQNEVVTVADVEEMKYLRACMKESYRLSPTSGGVARILNSPAVFSGFEVPENTLCIGINPIISKQSEHFLEPLEFKPERWLDENNIRIRDVCHPYCILPFSHGVRRCIGQRFAEQEIRLCIVKIIQNFKVEYSGPEIGSRMRMLLIPDKPMHLKFIDRS